MTKSHKIALKRAASEAAAQYSRTDRDHNYLKESFAVQKIIPHSDQMASVVFVKTSGKLAVALFYYISVKGQWRHWFPTDSHIAGLDGFKSVKEAVERENFETDFEFETNGFSR
jgi:hypothetical protein